MPKLLKSVFFVGCLSGLLLVGILTEVSGQDTLSAQVLRLLDRVNTWSVTQTFTNVVINGTCSGVGCAASAVTTWTPALTSGGGTLPTFTTITGNYVTLGTHGVMANAELANTTGGTAGSGTNQLSISLPFTSSASQISLRLQVGSATNGTNEDSIYVTLDPAAATALLWRLTITAGEPELVAYTNADLNHANIRHLDVQFFYLR
jgi:hypothetical protein